MMTAKRSLVVVLADIERQIDVSLEISTREVELFHV